MGARCLPAPAPRLGGSCCAKCTLRCILVCCSTGEALCVCRDMNNGADLSVHHCPSLVQVLKHSSRWSLTVDGKPWTPLCYALAQASTGWRALVEAGACCTDAPTAVACAPQALLYFAMHQPLRALNHFPSTLLPCAEPGGHGGPAAGPCQAPGGAAAADAARLHG